LKKIMNELPQIDEKTLAQFWQDSFSKDWLKIKWVSLKFQGLKNSDNFENGVMKQWVLNDLLQQGFSNYENDLWALEVAEKQKIQAEKDAVKKSKVTELENKKTESAESILEKTTSIWRLSTMLDYSEMSNIDDWDDIFNIWDITAISLSEIKSAKNPQDAVKLIEEELWDEISEENKLQIATLCNQIILYLTHKNLDKDIETIWDLYDNSSDKSKEFFEYVSWKITLEKKELEWLQEKDQKLVDQLAKLWVKSTQEEMLAKSLLFIEEGKLSEWVKFWDNIMIYNPENWQLSVGDINYQLYYWDNNENNFSEITIDKWLVSFNVWIIKNTANKISVLSFLQSTILSKDTEWVFISWNNKITLKIETA
jgi:hypothetical protein